MKPEARLLFLPGLGGDHRLFSEQAKRYPKAQFVDMPKGVTGESLTDYAKRWADTESWSLPTMVVGFGFGGAVALEACLCHSGVQGAVKAVFLVSASRNKDAMHRDLRRKLLSSRLIPQTMMRRTVLSFAERFSKDDHITEEQREYLREMAKEMDLGHLRWGSQASCRWLLESTEEVEKLVPVFQVHGGNDEVVSVADTDADFVVAGAGHMLQYTHAHALHAYMEKCAGELGYSLAHS